MIRTPHIEQRRSTTHTIYSSTLQQNRIGRSAKTDIMTTLQRYQHSAALWPVRAPVTLSPFLSRSVSNQKPHGTSKPDAPEPHPFDLKRLGATRTVQVVVYGALGITAIAETTFWCSWLWGKMKTQESGKREDHA